MSANNLTLQNQGNMEGEMDDENIHHGVCAICLDNIILQETAIIKGCEHAYCATCIVQWASYNEHPKCPQCKHPFESLHLHRSIDGSIQDYMVEESICVLARASWFKPLVVVHQDDLVHPYDELLDPYQYVYEPSYYEANEEDDDEEDEIYFKSLRIHIGNRRWGDNGYIRSGQKTARSVHKSNFHKNGASSSSEPKKEGIKTLMGRRAKRAMKREAADKAKHQQQTFG